MLTAFCGLLKLGNFIRELLVVFRMVLVASRSKLDGVVASQQVQLAGRLGLRVNPFANKVMPTGESCEVQSVVLVGDHFET